MLFELPRSSGRAAADRALPLYIAPEPSLLFRWVKVRRLHRSIQKYELLEQCRGPFRPTPLLLCLELGASINTIGARREAMHGVNMFSTKRNNSEAAIGYATAASFIEIYNEEMHSLFLLSILLTADLEKAEQCFVGALEECLDGIDVFMEWARLWARRAIIKRAIKLVNPVPEQPKRQPLASIQWHSTPVNDNLIGAIFRLGAFERFVFVVSLLERQSDEDCSALLSCRLRDIQLARVQALKSLPDTDGGCNPFEEALQAWEFIRARQSARRGTQVDILRRLVSP